MLAGSLAQAVNVQQIIDALKGTPSKGVPIALVSLNDSANYALSVQNDDPTNSRALSVLKADGTTLISADATGVTLGGTLHLPVGSITTASLAGNAVSQWNMAAGVSSTPTTTSTSYVDLPDIALTLVTGGGDLLVWFASAMTNSGAGGVVAAALSLDGAAERFPVQFQSPAANQVIPISIVGLFGSVSAASHTVKARWLAGSGTAAAQTTQRYLLVLELKR